MLQKILLLILLTACASAPKNETVRFYLSESHPSCKIHADDLDLSIFKTSEATLTRGLKSTGSLMFTTVGYATDVLLVGGGMVGLAVLCGEHFAVHCVDSSGLFELYSSIGKRTYKDTATWRCPYVDHISEVVRKSAACNYQHGHYIESYEQLNFLENNQVMKECASE
nr:hypothetical protein [Bdellovibrionales bacterium]